MDNGKKDIKRKIFTLRRVTAGVVMGVVLPLCVGVVVHYGYLTNYTTVTFSEEGFTGQYDGDVYAYRPLSRELLLFLHAEVGSPAAALDQLLWPHRLLDLDPRADAGFYHMYALMRIAGLVLFSSLLWVLLGQRRFALSLQGRTAAGAGLLLLVVLSMFVVTPYDLWSWSALIVAFLFLVTPRRGLRWLLLPLIFLATLNHEASILILAVLGTTLWEEQGLRALRSPLLWLSVLAFALPYAGVRLLTDGWAISSRLLFPKNMLHAPAVGVTVSLSFAAALTALAFALTTDAKRLLRYTTLAMPWLAGILLFGILWELRLWMMYLIPLLLFAMIPGTEEKGPGGWSA